MHMTYNLGDLQGLRSWS